jgi:glycosyltransferase involved in cell wall biosynthesis
MSRPNNPLISIVIPTYNHAHFLHDALISVITQTYRNWEAIVIDNHSNDNTDQVVHSFGDARIKLLKVHNQGIIATSRNKGIKEAKGKWVAFLDSDDLWYPKKLELAVDHITQNPEFDVCSTNELMVNRIDGGRRTLHHGPYCKNFYERLLLRGNCLSPSAAMVKRVFLEDNQILFREDNDFVTAEDYDFWLLLASKNARFTFIDSVQGEYTIHANNETGKLALHQKNVENVLLNHASKIYSSQRDSNDIYIKLQCRIKILRFAEYARNKRYKLALKELISSLKSSPRFALSFIYSRVASRLS